ncbi:MAG: endolytic transglycosylase MltG [Patescibacteria group bacterium]
MKTARSFSLFFLAVGALVFALLLYLGNFTNTLLRPAGNGEATVMVAIPSGSSLRTISDTLARSGVVTNPRAFQVYVWLRGWSKSIKAGEYELPRNLNVRELAYVLLDGNPTFNERTITVIEGWTVSEVAHYLATQGVVNEDDFLKAVNRQAAHATVSVMSDKPASASLEGYLFPDSYRIYKGASADEVIAKMLSTLDQKFTSEMREAVAARGGTVYETLILASILEREIKHQEDLPRAAGVFMNRLAAGELLQSDATLNYVLPENERSERLSLEQVGATSPYNTYRNPGLPPTPISNPGLAAIRAAVYPATTKEWYFLTDKSGVTHFAETYAEHLANKRQYFNGQ